MNAPAAVEDAHTIQWGKVIDHSKCIGCHACTTACKSENEVPLGVTRTYVKSVDVGEFPQARRAFQVTRCNQCVDAPCVTACPTTAMHKRKDGIVDFDKSICIGCKACIAACPYDAIFINPNDGAAEKCNFCAHRLDVGLEPACVVVCPTEAILIGDMNDTSTKVAQIVNRQAVAVRKPEKATRPKLYYKGAHAATLDPLAARQPTGGLFMWSEQDHGPHNVVAGVPGNIGVSPMPPLTSSVGGGTASDPVSRKSSGAANGGHGRDARAATNSSAAALLSYDVRHSAPWDWRVSAYTVTKAISAGAYIIPAIFVALGWIPADSAIWQWAAPIVAMVFLAITGALLLWDLEHPLRFLLIFTKRQWGSWLVRGGFIINAFGLVLTLHLLASVLNAPDLRTVVGIVGVPVAIMTAIYTAYLFAQAKARDLWQNPLLPPHMFFQTLMAGAAILLPVMVAVDAGSIALVHTQLLPTQHVLDQALTLGIAGLIHVLFVVGEITMPHPTAHAKLAARNMTHGRYARFFWSGLVLATIGAVAGIALFVLSESKDAAGIAMFGADPTQAWIAALPAIPALIGLALHEHAYVQAGQSVPLA